MFRYRESFSESIANTRNGYGCKQEHSSASRRPFKIQIEFHHKCIIKYDYGDDKHKRIPEAVFQPACRREEANAPVANPTNKEVANELFRKIVSKE